MRKTEIDVAKGFALFSVVFAHVLEWDHPLTLWIFMFHMPAFFFLSGMTFRPAKYPSFSIFLKDKLKKRIRPYFIIAFIGFIICMLRPYYRQPILDAGWPYLLMSVFFYGHPQNLYIGQIWFLTALFSAEVIAWLWFRFFGQRSASLKCFSLLLLSWMAMSVPRLNQVLPLVNRLPWKIDTALCAAVFLIAGYYAASINLFTWIEHKGLCWFLLPFTAWLSYYFGPKWYGYVNMCDCIYSPGPYYFLVAFLGISCLFLAAVLCKNSKFWQYCGRYSLPMFSSQTFAIYGITELIERTMGIIYIPRYGIPNGIAVLISIAAFAIIVILVYPWHRYQTRYHATQNTTQK